MALLVATAKTSRRLQPLEVTAMLLLLFVLGACRSQEVEMTIAGKSGASR